MTTKITHKHKDLAKDLRAARAAKGVKPGVYENEAEIMANFQAEAAADDELIRSMPAPVMKRGRPAKGAIRPASESKVMTMRVSSEMLRVLQRQAAANHQPYTEFARSILWRSLQQHTGTQRGLAARCK